MNPHPISDDSASQNTDILTAEDQRDVEDALLAEEEAKQNGTISLRDYMKKNNIPCTPSA